MNDKISEKERICFCERDKIFHPLCKECSDKSKVIINALKQKGYKGRTSYEDIANLILDFVVPYQIEIKNECLEIKQEQTKLRLKDIDKEINYLQGILTTLRERFEGSMSDCVVCHTYWEESEDLQDKVKERIDKLATQKKAEISGDKQ